MINLETMTLSVIKLLMPLLVSSFLIIPSHATGFQVPFSWDDYGEGSASVIYNSDYSDESRTLVVEIDHSTSGLQRLYFNDFYTGNLNSCKYQTTVSDATTIVFNNQAVKMSRWCKKFSDADKYYLELTPATVRGQNYVINLFKAATSPISLQYNNETLYFPVMGFTKAWNSAGGNAI